MSDRIGNGVDATETESQTTPLSRSSSAVTLHTLEVTPSALYAVRSRPESIATKDGGLTGWLQVLSGYFLFFNCWYATTRFDKSKERADIILQGTSERFRRLSDVLQYWPLGRYFQYADILDRISMFISLSR